MKRGCNMLKKLMALLSVSLILVPSIATAERKEVRIGDPVPAFTLKDAHNREHSLEKLLKKGDARDKVVILVMGNREVRKEASKWAVELDKIRRRGKKVAALMVADLRGLPFFVTKGMVKRFIRRANPPVTVVLDWDGKVNELYKAQRNKVNVFIVDGGGRVCYRKVGSYSDRFVRAIQENVWDNLIHKSENQVEEHVVAGTKPHITKY